MVLVQVWDYLFRVKLHCTFMNFKMKPSHSKWDGFQMNGVPQQKSKFFCGWFSIRLQLNCWLEKFLRRKRDRKGKTIDVKRLLLIFWSRKLFFYPFLASKMLQTQKGFSKRLVFSSHWIFYLVSPTFIGKEMNSGRRKSEWPSIRLRLCIFSCGKS